MSMCKECMKRYVCVKSVCKDMSMCEDMRR